MNDVFFKDAIDIIDNLRDEKIHQGLKEAGVEFNVRQYPERNHLIMSDGVFINEPIYSQFLEPMNHG